jgi:hypothetical protein
MKLDIFNLKFENNRQGKEIDELKEQVVYY